MGLLTYSFCHLRMSDLRAVDISFAYMFVLSIFHAE